MRALRALLTAGLGFAAACTALASLDVHQAAPSGDGGLDAEKPDDAGPSDGASDAPSDACGSTVESSRNCGACGHDCLGGACVGGRCQPEELAANQDQPRRLIVRNGTVYWMLEEGNVRSCRADDCKANVHVVADAGYGGSTSAFRYVAADATHVYWGDYYKANPPTVWRVPIDGGAVEPFAQGGPGGTPGTPAYAVVVDDAGVYWSGDNPSAVLRCPKTPGQTCADPILVGTSGAFTRTLAENAGVLFWLAQGPDFQSPTGTLYRAPKDAFDNATILAIGLFNPQDIAAADGVPYYTLAEDGGRTTGKVMAYAVYPGQEIIGGQFAPTFLAVDDTHVYWVSEGDAEIRRCPRAGKCLKAEILATGQLSPQGLAVDAKAVYWSAGGTGKIMRVAK